jgi:hypothetical protein
MSLHHTGSTRRILIWGKTYPELSDRYSETVCTGGCFEDGTPVRIYPIPLRYLPKHRQYRLYDWIEVPVAPSTKHRRPESFKARSEALRVLGHLDPERGWQERRKVIFANRSWHYECLEDLKLAERRQKTSMGFVKAGAIEWVKLEERTDEERKHHEAKLARLQSKLDLFGPAQRDLAFYPYKVRVGWRCARLDGARACPGHTATVLDWGLGELGRREGPKKALARMEDVCNLERHDLRFYVGNFKAHPKNFGIVGLWFPLRAEIQRHAYVQEALSL